MPSGRGHASTCWSRRWTAPCARGGWRGRPPGDGPLARLARGGGARAAPLLRRITDQLHAVDVAPAPCALCQRADDGLARAKMAAAAPERHLHEHRMGADV